MARYKGGVKKFVFINMFINMGSLRDPSNLFQLGRCDITASSGFEAPNIARPSSR